MSRPRLLWKLFPTYLVVIFLCTAGVGGYASSLVWDFYHDQVRRELEATALLVRDEVLESNAELTVEVMDALADARGQAARMRVTIIEVGGKVLGDSEKHPERDAMDNHAQRPEIRTAVTGDVGEKTRYSDTLKMAMMYVAVPVVRDGQLVAVVRTARPLDAIQRVLANMYLHLGIAGIVVAVVAGALSMLVTRRISHPLKRMMQGAARFADGDFTHKLHVADTEETAALAESLNSMAVELDQKLRTITRQKTEQEAILSSMAEGVVAVDTDGKVIMMNAAAARLLEVDQEKAKDRVLEEVVRNVELRALVLGIITGRGPDQQEIVLRDGAERTVQVRGSALRDASGHALGVLVVLNDLTRLNRLETMRRDFVANVSHELKTPITSIKGSVETLREGGLEDREKAGEFLDILGRHADRLDAIIDDLLSLSRIERETEGELVQRTQTEVRDVLLAAVADCSRRRTQHDVNVQLVCPDDLEAEINPQLIEQAVVNLLDNAIKYSPPGSRVLLQAGVSEGKLRIDVTDPGCGIAQEHLARIFERFYRVDKARSRKLGGTGLGLAIVKHIARAHGGTVSVKSALGKGSTFSILMPLH